MACDYDPKLYALLVRIARETTRPADVYDVMLTGTRVDSSTFRYGQKLGPGRKDDVPWDTVGDIHSIQWHPGGEWRNHGTIKGDKRNIEIKTDDWFGGIMVTTGYTDFTTELDRYMPHFETWTVGLKGTVRAPKNRVELDSEDAVVAHVIDMIEFGYKVVTAEQGMAYEEGDVDRAFESGPLSELGAFERFTGERARWVI
jgi:hypothetical protein